MTVQIARKICRNTPDEVCLYCPQHWKGECRAFLAPDTKDEQEHRLTSKPVILCRPFSSRAAAYQAPLWS